MRIGSLFSGAGGLDMAVEAVFGGQVVWQSEMDKAASKVLAYRYPGVPNLGDITKANWNAADRVDVICGGFPCQDVSVAGKQAGLTEGTRSGLWAEMARIIGLHSPQFVVIENVRGLLSAAANRQVESDDQVMGDRSDRPLLRAMGAVLGDLADLGYDAQWATIAASEVGAPHRRDRVFILAHAESVRWDERWPQPEGFKRRLDAAVGSDADVEPLLPTPTTQDGANTAGPSQFNRNTLPLNAEVTLLPAPRTSDPAGAESRSSEGFRPQLGEVARTLHRWGKYAPAIHRWESLTRPAPAPTEPNKNGNPRLSAAFSEWLMGWPAGWVTDPDIGISRNDQLRIVGNGVVPQQAIAALRYLLSVSEVAA